MSSRARSSFSGDLEVLGQLPAHDRRVVGLHGDGPRADATAPAAFVLFWSGFPFQKNTDVEGHRGQHHQDSADLRRSAMAPVRCGRWLVNSTGLGSGLSHGEQQHGRDDHAERRSRRGSQTKLPGASCLSSQNESGPSTSPTTPVTGGARRTRMPMRNTARMPE